MVTKRSIQGRVPFKGTRPYTGVLNLENANPLFLSQELVRRNYLVKWAEILHGTLLGDSAWVSRGVFGYSTWGPSNGVPLGVPKEGSKILKIFF